VRNSCDIHAFSLCDWPLRAYADADEFLLTSYSSDTAFLGRSHVVQTSSLGVAIVMCDTHDRQILFYMLNTSIIITTRAGGVTDAQLSAYALWTTIVAVLLGKYTGASLSLPRSAAC